MFTDEIIDAMVAAVIRPEAPDRERHLYREALRSLVNLAKVEATQEMNTRVQNHLANPASLH